MDPKPDYGYDSYKGSGKLRGKVRVATATTCICTFTPAQRHADDVSSIHIRLLICAIHAAAAAAASIAAAAVLSCS